MKKVMHYNKWSKGRSDLAVFQDGISSMDESYGNGAMKIVESETKVPFTNNVIKMMSLMHARPIVLDDNALGEYSCTNLELRKDQSRRGYIMVSRSVSKLVGSPSGEKWNDMEIASCMEAPNEIIWGVNVLLEVPEHEGKTEMITLTQAKSSAVPNFLVNKVCVQKNVFFINNLIAIYNNEI